jgi:hypothetical protein
MPRYPRLDVSAATRIARGIDYGPATAAVISCARQRCQAPAAASDGEDCDQMTQSVKGLKSS